MSSHASAIFVDGTSIPVTNDGLAAGARRGPVVLAATSEGCLCASILLQGLPPRNRRQAMLYRLEEKLPLAAEEFAGDFIVGDQTALGICAQTNLLRQPLDLLREHGMAVEAVVPLAVLALQRRADLHGAEVVLWGRDESAELFVLQDGQPAEWHVLPNAEGDIRLHLQLQSLNGQKPQKIHGIGLSTKVVEALNESGFGAVTEPAASMEDAAAAMAAEILAGRAKPWVDLGRDGLTRADALRPVRWPLRAACAAVAALMICISGAMLWRAAAYQRLVDGYDRQQPALFHAVFPNQPPPVDIPSRLAAAEREQRLLRGAASAPLPAERGLLVLRDVLSRLPSDRRYRVLEVHLDGNHFTLDGQTTSHAGADAIASALRSGSGFSIEPARTEQLGDDAAGAEKAVSFTINGDAPAGSPAGEGAR